MIAARTLDLSASELLMTSDPLFAPGTFKFKFAHDFLQGWNAANLMAKGVLILTEIAGNGKSPSCQHFSGMPICTTMGIVRSANFSVTFLRVSRLPQEQALFTFALGYPRSVKKKQALE